MIARESLKIGDKVCFGRPNGEKTLGVIEKLNGAKAKVKTLEVRGSRDSAGESWSVPYNLLYPAPADANGNERPAPENHPRPPLKYNVFGPSEDNFILEAILSCYGSLSPENLSCDGEASRSHVTSRRAELNRKLKGLFLALGREVSEDDAYAWDRSKREFLKSRNVAPANAAGF